MASTRELLNQVWAMFRQAGIADDLAIIERIAALLLLNNLPRSQNDELWPRMPPEHPEMDTKALQQTLTEAADRAGNAATLLDRHVLFRLPTMLPGGRYPTPRHIVTSMLRLADVESTHRLGDFACGSGGFLVHHAAYHDGKTSQTTGIEISPEWARLAWANTMLHGLTSSRIDIGNALQVCGAQGALASETFDRIVMNPSFGEKIDPKLAEKTLGFRVGSRSETALTALALHKLAPDGRAAILVPSGLLFSNSTGERQLRKRLVDELELEAILSFPREAFQPYSTLQTHLVLVSNRAPEGHSRTWFFQAEYDGYPAGRGRDLTRPPTGPNDLPFIEGVVSMRNTAFDATFGASGKPRIGIKKIVDDHKTLLGVVIEGIESTTLSVIERFPATDKQPAFLLAEGHDTTEAPHICVQIDLDSGQTHEVPDRNELINRLYKPRRQDPSPGTVLFRGDSPRQAAAISNAGRLLGLTVARHVLSDRSYELQPNRYLKTQEVPATTESVRWNVPSLDEAERIETPAALLASIRRNHRDFLQHIDGLLGRLELTPITGQVLPSPLLTVDGKPLAPFGLLSQKQKTVWDHVRKKVRKVRDVDPPYDTATLFTPEEVNPEGETDVSDDTRSTLDLLERMGVIIPVSLADPQSGESTAFYRRVTERDQWQLDAEAPDAEVDSV